MPPLLRISNIETCYGRIQALRGVSLELEEGTVTAVLGPNGAGKTTILRTLMGLLEDQPEKGTVEYSGGRIDGRRTEEIVRMGISYVPEGREVFEELSVLENLMVGAYPQRNRTAIRRSLERAYAYFPVLAERRAQPAGTLSGGEQQMLALARALMNQPRLLLLDEPSLGLSPLLVRQIFRIVREINQEGVTILLMEQNARMALKVSHFALVLENGRFVTSGPAEELAENEDVREFYLGLRSGHSIKGYQRYRRKKQWR